MPFPALVLDWWRDIVDGTTLRFLSISATVEPALDVPLDEDPDGDDRVEIPVSSLQWIAVDDLTGHVSRPPELIS